MSWRRSGCRAWQVEAKDRRERLAAERAARQAEKAAAREAAKASRRVWAGGGQHRYGLDGQYHVGAAVMSSAQAARQAEREREALFWARAQRVAADAAALDPRG